MGWLDPEELKQLLPAETSAFPSPIPTQSVSSDEFMPAPQTAKQREFEARVKEYGAALARRQGMSRRAFFTTAAGMAAAFVAMNDTYGRLYTASRAEAGTPELANERAKELSDQFIMDMHTHFLRDDTRLENFVRARETVGKAGWNPALAGKPQTLEDLKFANYVKEIFLDSDTKVAGLSGAPSDLPEDWFLTNEMKAEARAKVNQEAGSRRMLAQAIFTPGQPGWLEQVDQAIEVLKPDSFKGYTIGDNTNKHLSKYPWRMDDEKVVYPFYERCLKAGLVNIACTKGCSRHRSSRSSHTCWRIPMCEMWAKRRRTGRNSTSSSITRATATAGAAGRRKGGHISRRRAASNGSATWPRFPPNTGSPMSTATWGKFSPSRRWPTRGCAPP